MLEIVGRYEILEKLGEGGFAIVYKGRDTTLDRLVALKELRPMLLQDQAWVKRFQREARTIARLDHPNIVPIYDVHQWEDRLFIVMRLVEGVGLEEQIRQQGHLSWGETLHTMVHISAGWPTPMTRGAASGFEAGQYSDRCRARPPAERFWPGQADGGVQPEHERKRQHCGHAPLHCPGVWEGQPPSVQSDIYAMGCILYEMINGEKIFRGDTPPAVMLAHFKPLSLPHVCGPQASPRKWPPLFAPPWPPNRPTALLPLWIWPRPWPIWPRRTPSLSACSPG